MKTIDPEGVSMRKAYRLKRRKYSRRILWLEVSQSNNPRVIAMYYFEAIRRFGVAPRLLRCDGTENSTLSLLQPFFRYNDSDCMSGLKSSMYGKSVLIK